MLVKPSVLGQVGYAVQMPMQPGDIMDSCDVGAPFVEDQTAGGTTLSQVDFGRSVSPALEVSGNAGAVATTLPTAQQIIDAIKGNAGIVSPPNNSPFDSAHDAAPPMEWPSGLQPVGPNQTFRWIIRNLNGGTNTVTAPASSGVAVVGTATVATNKWREYIVRILSGAPTTAIGVTTTNASKIVNTTDTITLRKIQPGMSAYGTGAGASAKVVSVDYNTGNITLDVNSSATSALPVGWTFTPTVTFTNLRAGDV